MKMKPEDFMDPEYLIQQAKCAIEKIKNKKKYQRGDAEDILQEEMFISIMQAGIDKEKELGRKPSVEENHEILRDHGWTVTPKPAASEPSS